MKKILLIGAIASSVLVSSALSADNLNIYTGGDTGNYYKVIGPSLSDQMKKLGYEPKVLTSNGSVDNINMIADPVIGKNSIGVAQADVAHDLIESDDKYEDVELNGNLGYECGFLVVRKDKIDDIKSFKSGDKIAAGKEGSGTLHTFKNLVKLNPELEKVEISEKSGIRYIDKVANNSYAGYFFMSVPDPERQEIKDVLNSDVVEFLPFDKSTLSIAGYDQGVNPIYSFQTVPVKTSFGKTTKTLETVCTYAGIVANEGAAGDKLLNNLYKASKNVKTEKETAWGFFEKVKEDIKDKVDSVKSKM